MTIIAFVVCTVGPKEIRSQTIDGQTKLVNKIIWWDQHLFRLDTMAGRAPLSSSIRFTLYALYPQYSGDHPAFPVK